VLKVIGGSERGRLTPHNLLHIGRDIGQPKPEESPIRRDAATPIIIFIVSQFADILLFHSVKHCEALSALSLSLPFLVDVLHGNRTLRTGRLHAMLSYGRSETMSSIITPTMNHSHS
jgi:hypothetical protein